MIHDAYSGNRHMYVGTEHIWTHIIGFHGNILIWGISQLEIFQDGALPNLESHFISSDLVCFNIN